MQRPGGNPVQEFTSRKFILTLIALITVCYMAIVTKDAQWGLSIIGVLGQYAYANYMESKNTIKDIEFKKMDIAAANGNNKPPIEQEAQ